MMSKIKTYGELCAEIERVEKVLKEIRSRSGYDYLEDDIDFILYLDYLKKMKRYNEQRYELMEKLGIEHCDKCKGVNLEIESQPYFEINGYRVAVNCNDCGHVKYTEISKVDLKYYVPELCKDRYFYCSKGALL